jgi:hypothetical protein
MSRIKGSNADFAGRWGTHRQRFKKQEVSTQKFFEIRGERIKDATHDALDLFERQLETYTGPQHDADADSSDDGGIVYGDYEVGEDDVLMYPLERVQHRKPGSNARAYPRVKSAPSRSFSREILRPSSPLARYDYGNITIRPNSVLAQRINSLGDAATGGTSRPSSSPGFYNGGPAVKAGYGFSMLDPILMPKETTHVAQAPPLRFNGPCDIRPPSAPTKVSSQPVITPKGVRMTSGHAKRCSRSHATLKQQVVNEKVEELQFQNGVFGGRWRDPTLDGPLPEDPATDGLEWLTDPPHKLNLIRKKAARILFGLDRIITEYRVRVTDLFAGFDQDASGFLEPDEFYRGLIKLKVVAHDEITEGEILQVLKVIDANFDGYVSLPELVKVLDTVKNVKQTEAARKRRAVIKQKMLEKEQQDMHEKQNMRVGSHTINW